MNIENDFLTDLDLFGKIPELYYKGRSKKSSTLGIILTVIYIILYFTFLIYKLIRMFQRVELTFYDSYTFKGIPSINLTNNEFYGGFGMGGIVDERMYYLNVTYVSKQKVNGKWVDTVKVLDTEICKLEWFGPAYQEIFSDQPLDKYYCIKDVSGMVLEGYSNLERYSYFNVKFYPCYGTTKDGTPCHDKLTLTKFFTYNSVELKIQDNDLNPEDYKNPVTRRQVDMNSPVFKDIMQFMFSYLQIVNIETDEDITGLNFFSDNIRKQQYTRYENSFIITSPLLYGDILEGPRRPIADVTLQLAAKVLTEKRQYTQLIDVLGDVGGLMEILYTFLNLISSLITEVLYDKSLVNTLFTFDLNRKYVIFNDVPARRKSKLDSGTLRELPREDSNEFKNKFQDLENNKNIDIYSNENSGDQNMMTKNAIASTDKKVIKRRKSNRSLNPKASKSSLIQFKDKNSQDLNAQNDENKPSFDENKNIISNYNAYNNQNENDIDTNYLPERELRNIYINNWLICCFWCSSKKKNINRILFEEGSKLITNRLDILNMFGHFYAVEIMQKQLGIELKGKNMTNNCKKNLHIYKTYNIDNNPKTNES